MSALRRWWVYQGERFPLLQHGPLILAFSFSAVAFSWMLRSSSSSCASRTSSRTTRRMRATGPTARCPEGW